MAPQGVRSLLMLCGAVALCQGSNSTVTVTHKVYFNVSLAGRPHGRIVIGLMGNVVPRTAMNFYKLAQGVKGVGGYKGTVFHRVYKNFVVQGGDIDGKGGKSIYGRRFDDENFHLDHYGFGWVTMANAGPDDNGSQFAIMTNKKYKTDWLNKKVVVFGKVLEGIDLLLKIETVPTRQYGAPAAECKITDSGVIPVPKPFEVDKEPVDYMPDDKGPLMVTHKVYFDFQINGRDVGRVTMGLFGDLIPWTTQDVVETAKGFQTKSSNETWSYKGSQIYRVHRNFVVQGGDIENKQGWGKLNYFGTPIPDERFINHPGNGWVASATAGPDDNVGQFAVMTNKNYKTDWLDGLVVLFAKILDGIEVIEQIERGPTVNYQPSTEIVISRSGVLDVPLPFPVKREPVVSSWDRELKITHMVTFEVSVGGMPGGQIVLGLFGEVVPKTVKNFFTIATSTKKNETYLGTKFHRVIHDFVVQGGDIDGNGGHSIYGRRFDDENFKVIHHGSGMLTMANAGYDDNGSQFCIMTNADPKKTEHLDYRVTVFGTVLEGINVVRKIDTVPTGQNQEPLEDCIITKSWGIRLDDPITIKPKPVPYQLPDPNNKHLLVTHKAFMDIDIDGKFAGRIVVGLFGDIVPWATKNFVQLAQRGDGKGYKGSKFHRVIHNFIVQGGDFVKGNGYGGQSIWGKRFVDENHDIDHNGFGWLTMANAGPDDNGSQFVFMVNRGYTTEWLNKYVVVFGKTLEGADVLMKMQGVPSLMRWVKNNKKERLRPVVDISVRDSGVLPVAQPFPVTKDEVPYTKPYTDVEVTHKVYFDVTIGKKYIGRIVIGLFGRIVPWTVRNFYEFAQRNKTDIKGGYSGTLFHRVIENFVIQGGDVSKSDGTGCMSIYGGSFSDENFDLTHFGFGTLAMANAGANDNCCQFAIMTNEGYQTTWLDYKHVVFGKVIKGSVVVRKIQKTPTGRFDRPEEDIVISTGTLTVDKPFKVFTTPSED